MTLYFVTGNKGKFDEVKEAIPSVEQLDVDLIEIQSTKAEEVIGAKLKQASLAQPGESILVEDTSLYCTGLGDLPGPLIKWFLKSLTLDQLAELVKSTGNTHAVAVSMFGFLDSRGDINYFSGKVEGQIVSPRGNNGFGWDAIFQPNGSAITFAEMDSTQKNSSEYNMRKLAIDQFVIDSTT